MTIYPFILSALLSSTTLRRTEAKLQKNEKKEENSLVQMKINSKADEHFEGRQYSFLVQIGVSCTGSMITEDWVITAHHCIEMNNNFKPHRKFKDKVWNLQPNDPMQNEIAIQRPIVEDGSVVKVMTWRLVRKIVLNDGFDGESHSWKGYDLALLQLYPVVKDDKGFPKIKPVCLPFKNMAPSGNLLVSGFGKRKLPHCITDSQGPEKFGICGRPLRCTHDHRAVKCGLEFLYNGKLHTDCIKSANPSTKDPVCRRLAKGQHRRYVRKTSHVLSADRSSLVTTCYPLSPDQPTKGWCTVRDPGEERNKEPDFSSGWGFCSTDKDLDQCNSGHNIRDKMDLSIRSVTRFRQEFCVDQLINNLRVEQPEVTLENIDDLPRQFCFGRNTTVDLSSQHFYIQKSKNKFSKLEGRLDQNIVTALSKANPGNVEAIDGGPNCFGDSGGPVFSPADDSGDIILEGVFSYMLWGTCRGRSEPSYAIQLSTYYDWILRHIPKKEICVR